MTRALLILMLCASCEAEAPDPANSAADGGPNDTADAATDDSEPSGTALLRLSIGSRNEPFAPWADGDDVLVVQGPQGGFHTEHAALLTGADADELHLAIVWGEVWRDDLVLARAGWEFWDDQWERSGDGHRVELPVLIFDEQPQLGPARLEGLAELKNGRTATFEMVVDLVAPP